MAYIQIKEIWLIIVFFYFPKKEFPAKYVLNENNYPFTGHLSVVYGL